MVRLKLHSTLDWRIQASAILIRFKYACCKKALSQSGLAGIYQLQLEAQIRKYARAQGELSQRISSSAISIRTFPVPAIEKKRTCRT